MEHIAFLALNYAVLFAMVLVDRKRARDYALLGAFTLAAAFVFENATTYMGFWHYHSEPKALLISFYSWLLYVPYISFCYFAANKVVKHG